MKPRPWDVLLAFKLDRITRLGSVEGHAMLKTIFDTGARVETLKDSIPWDVPIARDILLALTFAIAQQESQNISERTLAARSAIAAGLRPGSLGGRPRRVTADKVAVIAELRSQRPPVPWSKVAQKVSLPIGTCRQAWLAHRRERGLPIAVATGRREKKVDPSVGDG